MSIFKKEDGFRFALEQEATLLAEAKERVAREAENVFVSKFASKFGVIKIKGSKTDGLELVQGPTSTAKIFDGNIVVKADVVWDGQDTSVEVTVPVTNNETELPSEEDLVTLLEKSTENSSSEMINNLTPSFGDPLYAGLDQFRLSDDGSQFFKIYHTAIDEGREIGIVSKDEYASIENKEAFFKEVLQNRFLRSDLENKFVLEFKGAFVEPDINVIEAEKSEITVQAALDPKCVKCEGPLSADSEGSVCAECEAEHDRTFNPLAASADAYRQIIETEASKLQSQKDKLLTRVVSAFVTHLHANKLEAVKVGTVDASSLEPTDQGFSGFVNVTASFTDDKGIKVATFPVSINNGNFTLPKKEVVAEISEKAIDLKSELESRLAKEAVEAVEKINEHEEWKRVETKAALEDSKVETITKTAGETGGIQYLGPVETMQLEKHLLNLPDDMEIGDTIFADGFHWKLTNKSKNQLSAGKDDGSIWTFTKVAPDDKEPKGELTI